MTEQEMEDRANRILRVLDDVNHILRKLEEDTEALRKRPCEYNLERVASDGRWAKYHVQGLMQILSHY